MAHADLEEAFVDQLGIGYDRIETDRIGACAAWLAAWDLLLRIWEARGRPSLAGLEVELDRLLMPGWAGEYVADLGDALIDAGQERPGYLRRGIEYGHQFLERFAATGATEEADIAGRVRIALATCHFELEEMAAVETLYAGWLDADPRWGLGWVAWAECHLAAPVQDVGRARTLIERGLAIDGVSDREALVDTLESIADDEAANGDEDEFDDDTDDGDFWLESGEEPAGSATPISPPRHFFRKLGRNEPCLCGSGLKYKKCCLGKTGDVASGPDDATADGGPQASNPSVAGHQKLESRNDPWTFA